MHCLWKFVTLTPLVAMKAMISDKVDVDHVIGELERVLMEQMAVSAERLYS